MFDFRERRTPRRTTVLLVFLLGATLGVAGGHWLGERGAAERAQEAGRLARAELAAAVCAEAFMDQEAAQVALARLVAVEWSRRADLLSKEGWATMPDRAHPERVVARLCAAKLGETYTSLRRTMPVLPTGG
jgi:hypothetical protein